MHRSPAIRAGAPSRESGADDRRFGHVGPRGKLGYGAATHWPAPTIQRWVEMTGRVVDQALLRRATSRSHAVVMVQAFAVAVMVFPSDMIIKAVGADGYPAILIAYAMLLAWVAATLFGLHNPLHYRSPVRMALWMLWLVSLVSYVFIDPAIVTPLERASADRWLMQLAGVSGVILFTAECLRSKEDIRRVLRALTWGGAFCGVVAALQFRLRLDVTPLPAVGAARLLAEPGRLGKRRNRAQGIDQSGVRHRDRPD